MWLIFVLHLFIGSTLAGSAVIVALILGQDTPGAFLIAVVVGFAVAFPLSWAVARRMRD
ncbi:MAG: CTP synthetase [Roseovarius sp.]